MTESRREVTGSEMGRIAEAERQTRSPCFLLVAYMAYSSDSEDAGRKFLRNVDLLDRMASIPEDSTLHTYRYANLKSNIL
jgi:hypothetical protein